MIDPKDVSVVIPVMGLSDQRLSAFDFVLSRLSEHISSAPVIVVEQAPFDVPFGSESPAEHMEHLKVPRSGKFCKSQLINEGVLGAKTPWVWIHDADVVLPFADILQSVPEDQAGVMPFRKIVRLTEAQTAAYMNGKQVKLDVKKTLACSVFGGGSLIVNRRAFLECRGFDEFFEGWGSEDVEFGNRFQSLFGVVVLEQFRGVHLHHPLVPKVQRIQVQARNLKRLSESREACMRDPGTWIRTGIQSSIAADLEHFSGFPSTATLSGAGISTRPMIRFLPKEGSGLISPAEQKIIQIDITNVCPKQCSNCTRLVGHSQDTFNMSEDTFRQAVDSLVEFPGMVGVMGGEPTLHPRFAEFSEYLGACRPDPPPGREQYTPHKIWSEVRADALNFRNWKKGLWTSLGPGYRKHDELIQRIYRFQCVNDHKAGGRHAALLVPRKDLGIPDREWLHYRNRCWVQRLWSASVTPRGAYFCEVAGSLAMLFGGPDGWAIEPGWWERDPSEFGDQLELCELCSACLPMPRRVDAERTDDVSAGMAQRLKSLGSKKRVSIVKEDWETLKRENEAISGVEPYLAPGSERVHSPCGLEMGKPIAVIVCKGYDDYLALTLPQTVAEIGEVLVVTAPEDIATQRVASENGAVVLQSNTIGGESFPKGKAIAEALATLPSDSWVLLLDADIMLPSGIGERLAELCLNPGALYYAKRIGPALDDWRSAVPLADLLSRGGSLTKVYEQIGERLYEQCRPWGYFQLFNVGAGALKEHQTLYPVQSKSAQWDDSEMSEVWYGTDRIVPLPDSCGTVVHLPHGETRVNWEGRRSPRLDDDAWWASDDSLRWRVSYRAGDHFTGLWQLLRSIEIPKGSVLVEIGTMLGDGAIAMSAACPDCTILSIDPGHSIQCVQEAAKRTSLWDNIRLIHKTSIEAAKNLALGGVRPFLVYVDGDHREPGVLADLETWTKLIVPGGYIAGHDYGAPDWPGVTAAVDRFLGGPDKVFPAGSWIKKLT